MDRQQPGQPLGSDDRGWCSAGGRRSGSVLQRWNLYEPRHLPKRERPRARHLVGSRPRKSGTRRPDRSGAAPPATDKPSAFTVEGPNTQHVVYRGTDNHIHEISWPEWGFARLRSHWRPDQCVHIEEGPPRIGVVPAGFLSARWRSSSFRALIYIASGVSGGPTTICTSRAAPSDVAPLGQGG